MLEEFWHVCEGAGYHAGMDEVKFLGIRPRLLCIIDFEDNICWQAKNVKKSYNCGLKTLTKRVE